MPIHPSATPESQALLSRAARGAKAGHLHSAESLHLEALHASDDIDSELAYACFLWRTGRYAAGARRLTDLIRTGRADNDLMLMATVTSNLAAMYRELGDRTAAARFQITAVQCEQQARRLGEDGPQSSDLLGQLATDAILAGNYGQAEIWLWRSLLQEMAEGSDEDQAADWGNLGLVAGLQGDFTTAVRYLREAWNLHRRARDLRGLGCDLMHLGQCVAMLGKARLGIRMLLRAARVFQKIQLPELAERALQLAGELETSDDFRPCLN